MIEQQPAMAEELSNPHDAFFKSLLGRSAVAEEFLRHYLPPEVTADFDLRTLAQVKDSFITEELQRYFSDLILRVKLRNGADVYVYILLEHKSAPEKWVALQLLGYEVQLWEQMKTAGATSLPLIVPVVIYHGRRRWRVAGNFSALVTGAARAEWRRYVPEFEYHLCDLTGYAEAEIAGAAGLRPGFLVMKNITRRSIKRRLGELISDLRNLPEARQAEQLKPIVRYVMATVKGMTPQLIEEHVRQVLPKQAGGVMQTAAEMLIAQGKQQGLQLGSEKQTLKITLRLLKRRLGTVSQRAEKQIRRLPLAELEALSEALLDFVKPADLTAWLRAHQPASNGVRRAQVKLKESV